MRGQRKCVSALLTLVFFTSLLSTATGRRGCLNFGHSCLGGHGKRSNDADQIVYPMEKDDLTWEYEQNSNALSEDREIEIKKKGKKELTKEDIWSILRRSLVQP